MDEIYDSFAWVYDRLMGEVPYREWESRVARLLRQDGISDGLVLDLGCGTGELTALLAEDGYDMIGADASPQMLQRAQEKARAAGLDILYLLQDMRSFELYGTVRAVVSACDSLNYLLDEEDLVQTFRLVNNYLDPGGLFLFDMNTPYKYSELLGDATFAWTEDDCACIWENSWYPDEQINEYDLTLFIAREAERDGRGEEDTSGEDGQLRDSDGTSQRRTYHRYQEVHAQRAYTAAKIQELLRRAGMQPLAVYDGYTDKAPGPACERWLFAAREMGKR